MSPSTTVSDVLLSTTDTVSSSSTVTATSDLAPAYSPPAAVWTRVTESLAASVSSLAFTAFTVTVCASSQVVASKVRVSVLAQTAQLQVGGVLAGHRHRHLDRRLVGQLHRIGLACGVSPSTTVSDDLLSTTDTVSSSSTVTATSDLAPAYSPPAAVWTRVTESLAWRRCPLWPSPSPSAHRPRWSRRRSGCPLAQAVSSRSVVSWPVTVTVTSTDGSWDSFTV